MSADRRGRRRQCAAGTKGAGRYRVGTPWGEFFAVLGDDGVRELRFPVRMGAKGSKEIPEAAEAGGLLGKRLARALNRYIEGGDLDESVPLAPQFDTKFHASVCEELRRIPRGQVRTYGQVAGSIGKPAAARAVGGACGANPICVFIPCHRVVASNGLGGFSAYLGFKRRLLELEGAKWTGIEA